MLKDTGKRKVVITANLPSRRSHINLSFTKVMEATQISVGFLGLTASSFMFFIKPRLKATWKRPDNRNVALVVSHFNVEPFPLDRWNLKTAYRVSSLLMVRIYAKDKCICIVSEVKRCISSGKVIRHRTFPHWASFHLPVPLIKHKKISRE